MQSIFSEPEPNTEYLCYNKLYSSGFTKLHKFVMLTNKYPELLINIRELVEFDKTISNNFATNIKSMCGIDTSLLNKKNNKGFTALMLACAGCNTSSSIDTVDLLISLGADVNIKSDCGYTALMLTQSECLHILIGTKINVNSLDEHKFTALMLKIKWDYEDEHINTLINAGAKLDEQNNYGQTALMFCKRASTVKLLLDLGADPTLKDGNNKTALMLAIENKNQSIIDLLKNKHGLIKKNNKLFFDTDRLLINMIHDVDYL